MSNVKKILRRRLINAASKIRNVIKDNNLCCCMSIANKYNYTELINFPEWSGFVHHDNNKEPPGLSLKELIAKGRILSIQEELEIDAQGFSLIMSLLKILTDQSANLDALNRKASIDFINQSGDSNRYL